MERTSRTLALACLVLLGLVVVQTAGAAGRRAGRLDAAILAHMNAVRSAHDLQPLRSSPELAVAARQHSVEMTRAGYFAHASADGGSFADRVRAWYAGGDGSWAVGENLLWSSPSIGGARAVRRWLASPDHRANILSAEWRDVGCAAVHAADAPGVYGDRPVTVVTCDFGRRG